jgi:hypothetical protein
MKNAILIIFTFCLFKTQSVFSQAKIKWTLPDEVDYESKVFNTEKNEVFVKIDITGLGSEKIAYNQVHFFNNEKAYTGNGSKMGNASMIKTGNGEYRISQSLQLNTGSNEWYLDIKLANETIKSKKIKINWNAGKPNLYLIAIGVPSNLAYTKSDAEAISNHFRTQGGNLFGRVESTVLVCKNNTSYSDVGNLLENYPNKGDIRPQDVLIVFISSHGKINKDGFGIVCSANNSENSESKYFVINYQKDIIDNLESINCKRILLFDACQSGQDFGGKGADFDKIQEQISKTPPSIITFASSRSNEKSWEDITWKHGAFTKAILDGLDGNADTSKDGFISVQELTNYVQSVVPTWVQKEKGKEQHPNLVRNIENDFTIFNYKKKAALENKIENCEEPPIVPPVPPTKNNVAVIGLKSDDPLILDLPFTDTIKNEIGEKGQGLYSFTPILEFSKAIKKGVVKSLMDGDESARRFLDPLLNADFLFVFSRSPTIFSQSSVADSPWIASTIIKYFKISVLTGEIVDGNEFSITGTDSQKSEAEKRAIERSLSLLKLKKD